MFAHVSLFTFTARKLRFKLAGNLEQIFMPAKYAFGALFLASVTVISLIFYFFHPTFKTCSFVAIFSGTWGYKQSS